MDYIDFDFVGILLAIISCVVVGLFGTRHLAKRSRERWEKAREEKRNKEMASRAVLAKQIREEREEQRKKDEKIRAEFVPIFVKRVVDGYGLTADAAIVAIINKLEEWGDDSSARSFKGSTLDAIAFCLEEHLKCRGPYGASFIKRRGPYGASFTDIRAALEKAMAESHKYMDYLKIKPELEV